MVHPILPLALAAALIGPAKGEAAAAKGEAYDGAAGELSIATPLVLDAEIRIDGNLDDRAWDQAALLHSFTQYEPVEGVPASQKTEVLVLLDGGALYFAVRAFDDSPRGIRATLAERDEFERSDDYVRFVLDTFNDQRRAYVFSVNPLGVQHDGVWNEGGGGGRRMGPPIDDNPDFLWESAGQVAEWGYAIEVRVPLKSLRFPEADEQDWGLQIIRKISRNGFEESWAPITNNIANRLTQSGKLTGLQGLDAGLFMEINPVVTGKRLGTIDSELGTFGHQSPEGDFGLNMTYGVTSNLTLDATYNPDFSQVEADAGQIAVNERFALFFPEKRPFFLEGTEIFNLPKQLVYTRSIANPIAGAKMTGKTGAWNLGYLGAVDESLSGGDNAVANVFRVRRDVGGSSTVGLLYTDRTVSGDEYNRLAGLDARLVMARRYTLTVLGSTSFTSEPGVDQAVGALWSARIDRAGRGFTFSAEVEDSNDEFEAGSGFIRRTGDTQVQTNLRYSWYGGRGDLVESWGPNVELQGYWDHDAFWAGRGAEEVSAQLGARVSFRGNVTVFANAEMQSYTFAPDGYDGLFVASLGGEPGPFYPDQGLFDGLVGFNGMIWANTFERVRGNVRFSWQEVPIFGRSSAAIEPADAFSGNFSLNLYPTRSLRAELGVRHTTINRKLDGSEYSSATIPRVRAQYQFSRAFLVRGIFEYASQTRGGLLDPVTGSPILRCSEDECSQVAGSDAHDFHVEGLVSYEPSPGTVFYVGYTREMKDFAAFRFRELRPQADGLFVKLSYRFRL
jgi:hypothetical protein